VSRWFDSLRRLRRSPRAVLLLVVAGVVLLAAADRVIGGYPDSRTEPPFVSACRQCGATFEFSGVYQNKERGRGQIEVSITNTGERGRLDFSPTTGQVLALGYDLGMTYPRGTNTLVGWESQLGHMAAPVLAPGATWSGSLSFDAEFHPRLDDGFHLVLAGFRDEAGQGIVWTYRTPWPPNQGAAFEVTPYPIMTPPPVATMQP